MVSFATVTAVGKYAKEIVSVIEYDWFVGINYCHWYNIYGLQLIYR